MMVNSQGNKLIARKLVVLHHVKGHVIVNVSLITSMKLHQRIRHGAPDLPAFDDKIGIAQNWRDPQPVADIYYQLMIIVFAFKGISQGLGIIDLDDRINCSDGKPREAFSYIFFLPCKTHIDAGFRIVDTFTLSYSTVAFLEQIFI